MKKRKIKTLGILALAALCCTGIGMKAASSGLQTVVEQDKSKVQAGETWNLTMRFENYEEISQGIYAYKATLDYNQRLFEQVQQDNFQSLNGWERLRFNPETKELVAIKRAGSTQAEAVVSLSMKAVQDIPSGTGTVKFSDVVMSQGGTDLAGGTANAVVDLVQKPGQTPEQPPSQNPSQNPSQTPGQTPGQTPSQNPSQTPSQTPGQTPSQIPNQTPNQAPAQRVDWNPGQNLTETSAQTPAQKPMGTPAQKPGGDAAQEPAEDAGKVPGEKPAETDAPIPEEQPAQDSAQTSAEEPGRENPAQTPASGAVSEPGNETAANSGGNLASDASSEVDAMTESTPLESAPQEQAGNGALWYILIPVGAAAAAGIVFLLMKNSKDKGDNNSGKGGKTFMALLLVGAMAAQLITSTIPMNAADAASVSTKGDINANGEVDDQDVELLQQHLIHESELTGDAATQADMNGDGTLTVTDLALLVQEVGKPRAELLSMETDAAYVNKQTAFPIYVQLKTNRPEDVRAIRINGQPCPAKKLDDGRYEMTYTLGGQSGVQTLSATGVQFADGTEIPVTGSLNVEVLRSQPVVENVDYSEAPSGLVTVTFDLTDADGALKEGNITLTDEDGNPIKTEPVRVGVNTLSFTKQATEVYLMQVKASYDLDSVGAGEHTYQNQLLSEQEIFASSDRTVSAKDILRVTAYRLNGSTPQEESELNLTYLKYYKDRYFVRVEMRDLPDFYAKIKSHRVADGKLYLELEDANTVQHTDGASNKLEVLYGEMTDDTTAAGGESFASLMARIKNHPTDTIKLTRDYDAADYDVDLNALAGKEYAFRGTLDGNGHTIYNLNGPLFDELQGATIQNLRLENVSISNRPSMEVGEMPTNRRAALANVAYSGTTIRNVHVTGLDILTAQGASSYYGGLVGRAQGGNKPIKIDACSVTGLNIQPSGASGSEGSQVGGIAGLSQNATVTNCYVEGALKGNSAIGGIIGEISSGQDSSMKNEIRNCITKVTLSTNNGGGGGILGQASSPVTLADNISLSTGSNGSRVYAWGSVTLTGTNLGMNESSLNAGSTQSIAKQSFSASTLRSLNFDESVWNAQGCSYDKLPSLKNSDPRYVSEGQQEAGSPYIPDYESLQKRPGYDKKKDVLYSNLYQLMPFYDAKYLVVDGRKLPADHILNRKVIQSIVAFDENKQIMTYLTEKDYDKLRTIRLLFTDGTMQDYSVSYKYAGTSGPRKLYRRVAMYKIDELGIEYNYKGYVIKENSALIDALAKRIQDIDYDRDINSLSNLNRWDRRGYGIFKQHFNENVKTPEAARRFALNLAGNVDGYSITQDNDLLAFAINQKLADKTKFNKQMYAYTYYDRLYGVPMGGTSLSELMVFQPEVYNKSLSFERVTNEFWNLEQNSTHVQDTQFSRYLAPLLRVRSPGALVERAVKLTTSYPSMDDWFAAYFSGRNLLAESPAKDYPQADYRGWTQLSKQPKFVMPILTLPENSAFLVSAPGTFLVGSQMVYMTTAGDAEQQKQLLQRMQQHGAKMANLYNNVLGIIDVSYLNKFADIQMDTYHVNVYGEQKSGKSTDPYHVNFNDMLNEWFDVQGGAVAYAYEGVIKYSDRAFNCYGDWTHEIGHNQSYKLFFKGNGFRPIHGTNNGNIGLEDYTDGHTTQRFGDGDVQWNLTEDFTPDRLVTSNLTQERINSVEKLDSYYKGMYEAIDFLDYIEALAFLQLTPAEQAKVAVQIQYPKPNDRRTVAWKKLTEQDFAKMSLKTVADLWKNQITIRPGMDGSWSQAGDGAYYSEGMYIRRWYQPYNDNSRTHSWGFTYTTWQMLGMAGYENGYLNWFTGKSRTDLDAIRHITGDPAMTWERFKAERYQKMEESRSTVSYLNPDALVAQYVNALKVDAANSDNNVTASTNVRRINYHYLKRVTNDFREDVLSGSDEVVPISSAEEFVAKLTQKTMGGSAGYYIGSYVLDGDIDLSGVTAKGDSLIDGCFMGKLDGNGHTITGAKAPIFSSLKFAHISNLTVENSRVSLPAREEKTGALANAVEYAVLENLTLRDISVNAKKETGALAGRLTGTIVQNVHVTNAMISGTARVGAFAGYVNQLQIAECSANGESTGTGNAVGGFAGEIVGGTLVKNSYAVGLAKGGSASDDVGGFTGYLNASRIENCFANVRADGRNGVAGFIGQSVGKAVVKNSLALSNQFKGYKFDGRTNGNLFENFSNNYERGAALGNSTLTRTGIDFTGKISQASEADLQTERFYTETLGWDSQVWEFGAVAAGGVPKLKNGDRNDSSSMLETQRIRTADEFVEKINSNRYARFILEDDIDLSDKNTLITAEFCGILEGNNHTITGNKAPLFQSANGATLRDLIVSDSQVTGTDDTGSLVGKAVSTTIENVHVSDAQVQGGSRVGGLAGSLENSKVTRSSVRATVSASGNEVGGLAGKLAGGSIENSYAAGHVQGGDSTGGLVGFASGTAIRFSHSAASVNGGEKVAGFVGTVADHTALESNIALGNQSNLYKFDGGTKAAQLAKYRNNFEYADSRGISNLTREDVDYTDKLQAAAAQQITSADFYTETLGWNADIWDFSEIVGENAPTLKGLDPKKALFVGVYQADIDSVEAFLTELAAHPNGEFTLTQDLDFADKQYEVGTVLIPGAFTGVIQGEGNAIRNLKNATLFEQFNGSVENLRIEDYNHGAVYWDGEWSQYVAPGKSDRTKSEVAVFAKHSMNARYTDLKLDRITMFGADRVAGLVAVDQYSTFERIDIQHIYVQAGKTENGNQSALLVGEKTGGSIIDCYVHGELKTEGKQCGGIVGSAHGNLLIDRAVANVYAVNTNRKAHSTMGMFVGAADADVKIQNSASIGLTTNAAIGKFYGTAADAGAFQNCYENSTTGGKGKADGTNLLEADMDTLKEAAFYRDTLKLDAAVWALDEIIFRKYSESVNPYGSGPQDAPEMIILKLN